MHGDLIAAKNIESEAKACERRPHTPPYREGKEENTLGLRKGCRLEINLETMRGFQWLLGRRIDGPLDVGVFGPLYPLNDVEFLRASLLLFPVTDIQSVSKGFAARYLLHLPGGADDGGKCTYSLVSGHRWAALAWYS